MAGKLRSTKYNRYIIMFAFWFCLGLLFGVQNFFYLKYKNLACSFFGIIFEQMPNFILWGIYTPFVIWLGNKYSLVNGHWKKSLIIHLAIAVPLAVAHVGLITFILMAIYGTIGEVPFAYVFYNFWSYWFYFQFVFYAGVLLLGYAINYYQKYREEESISLQLEKLLAESKLAALKMQLHPHFLFNTMNNISMLVRQNKNDEAVKIIAMLGDLLRHVLEHKERELITLKYELELSDKYLRIESIRFDGRLTYQINVEPGINDTLIPDLILQPAIENALKHGLKDKTNGAHISITACKKDDKIKIDVEDNGKGCGSPDSFYNGNGLGLKITRERIEKIFGDKAELTIDCMTDKFTKVTFIFPIKED